MKKKVILLLIIMLLLTGCGAESMVEKNIKKGCNNYEKVIGTGFGGGEGESNGYREYGYCDGKLISGVAERDSVIDLSYKYRKYDVMGEYYDLFKIDNALVFTENWETKDGDVTYGIAHIDYVVNTSDIGQIIKNLESKVVPAIGTTIKEDNIYIRIYTKDKEMDDRGTLISYIKKTNSDFNKHREKVNITLAHEINAEGYKYKTRSNDTKEKLKAAIKVFKENNDY